MLTVYSKDFCPQCDRLKMTLTQRGIPFKEVNISHDDEARAFLIKAGHRMMPQMYKDGKHVTEADL